MWMSQTKLRSNIMTTFIWDVLIVWISKAVPISSLFSKRSVLKQRKDNDKLSFVTFKFISYKERSFYESNLSTSPKELKLYVRFWII